MNMDAAKFWLDVVQFILMGAIAFYMHIVARQRVTQDKLDAHMAEVTQTLNGLGQRLARVEEAHRHSPTHGDMGALAKELGELRGDVQQMAGGLEGIRRAVDLINQHLLSRHE